MNQFVTGAMIKRLREKQRITQRQLAEKLNVSEKAVSRWETCRGYPDITLIEPLANALGVSVIELFSGENVVNSNKSCNMARLNFYVCPICGNIIQSAGAAVISCCGITLPAQEAEPSDDHHFAIVEQIEDEYYVKVPHEMSKVHFISFIASVRDNGFEIKKLYPEGDAEARFKKSGVRFICFYCNRHGLFNLSI